MFFFGAVMYTSILYVRNSDIKNTGIFNQYNIKTKKAIKKAYTKLYLNITIITVLKQDRIYLHESESCLRANWINLSKIYNTYCINNKKFMQDLNPVQEQSRSLVKNVRNKNY